MASPIDMLLQQLLAASQQQQQLFQDPVRRQALIQEAIPMVANVALPAGGGNVPTAKNINTSALISRIKGLSPNQFNRIGRFAQAAETSPRANLGRAGAEAQVIANQLGIRPDLSNNALLNAFNNVVRFADTARQAAPGVARQAVQFNIPKLL